jgi:hypothetical protein
MKKINRKLRYLCIILFLLIIVLVLILYYSHDFYSFICSQRGGKANFYSDARECEMKAKDAGNDCIFDEECEHGCVYDSPSSPGGHCADFYNRYGGYYHRIKNANALYWKTIGIPATTDVIYEPKWEIME